MAQVNISSSTAELLEASISSLHPNITFSIYYHNSSCSFRKISFHSSMFWSLVDLVINFEGIQDFSAQVAVNHAWMLAWSNHVHLAHDVWYHILDYCTCKDSCFIKVDWSAIFWVLLRLPSRENSPLRAITQQLVSLEKQDWRISNTYLVHTHSLFQDRSQ